MHLSSAPVGTVRRTTVHLKERINMTSTGFSLYESNWRQLVEIGRRTWLGVETQGDGWVFGEPGKMPTVLLEDVTGAMIPLLPLLDKPYPEVLGQLSGQEDAPQLLSRRPARVQKRPLAGLGSSRDIGMGQRCLAADTLRIEVGDPDSRGDGNGGDGSGAGRGTRQASGSAPRQAVAPHRRPTPTANTSPPTFATP